MTDAPQRHPHHVEPEHGDRADSPAPSGGATANPPDNAARDAQSRADDPTDEGAPGKRKRLFVMIAAAVLIAALVYGIYYWLVLSRHATTDNAYVGAESAQITPLVNGAIVTVAVSDTDMVKRGQILMTLDDADARIALDQALANLASVTRKYGQTTATGQALSAAVNARQADIARAAAQLASAQGDLARAQVDYDRRKALAASGAVSGDELTTATNALQTAQANLRLARAGIAQAESNRTSAARDSAANAALVDGTTAATAPDVLDARAKVAQARLDLARTVIRSPIDGVVAQRAVQIGQRIAAGTPAMTVVPIGELYVDANYKEGQLTKVAVGQPATLTSDLYGGKVVYHGRVVGFAGGTGSAFALIPAQNATGNWIKVVQRLPVRIALDPAELKAHPLRVGLSMNADIDLSARN